jgi:hypothetical protein
MFFAEIRGNISRWALTDNPRSESVIGLPRTAQQYKRSIGREQVRKLLVQKK